MGPRGQAEAVLQCVFLEAQPFLYTSQPLFQACGREPNACTHAGPGCSGAWHAPARLQVANATLSS